MIKSDWIHILKATDRTRVRFYVFYSPSENQLMLSVRDGLEEIHNEIWEANDTIDPENISVSEEDLYEVDVRVATFMIENDFWEHGVDYFHADEYDIEDLP
jgi:hypothetical protein